ncbi:unnamed protein product (mitochondrion) [Plasmodiophora brassicae]|uniref:Uncharacterized protein n=1 Tax=Plasmodiophora brassicae TaxID=37360 RepID=A0A3P3YG84_PLABS|nr:unnamed protein product [Plasmodiophora brassicae]
MTAPSACHQAKSLLETPRMACSNRCRRMVPRLAGLSPRSRNPHPLSILTEPPELHGEHTSETVHDETQSGDQVESRSAQEERFEDAARHSPPTDHNHDDQPDGHQLAREEPPQPQELPEQHDSKTSHATTHTHAQDTSGHEEGLEVGDSSAPSPQHQEIDVQQILTGIENRLVRQLSDLESRLRDTLESNVDLRDAQSIAERAHSKATNSLEQAKAEIAMFRKELHQIRQGSAQDAASVASLLRSAQDDLTANKHIVDQLTSSVSDLETKAKSCGHFLDELRSTRPVESPLPEWMRSRWKLATDNYATVMKRVRRHPYAGPVLIGVINWVDAVHKRWRPSFESAVDSLHQQIRDSPSLHKGLQSFVTVETLFFTFVITFFIAVRSMFSLCCRRSSHQKSKAKRE